MTLSWKRAVQALFQDNVIHLAAPTTLHISKAREQTAVKASHLAISTAIPIMLKVKLM